MPIKWDKKRAAVLLRLPEDEKGRETLCQLLERASGLIRPGAVYKRILIEHTDETGIAAGGLRFSSTILSRCTADSGYVYPFVLTLGDRLEKAAGKSQDLLGQYHLEVLGDLALEICSKRLESHIKKKYAHKKISSFSPGTLEDWQITEQKHLFSLLGQLPSDIGVRLTEHLLMVPRKSLSGFIFSTDTDFVTCRVCDRERCFYRRAPYENSRAFRN
jgi:hypothetical protein